MTNTINYSDLITRFATTGKNLYGERGWQAKASEATNISQPMISKLVNGQAPLTPQMAERLSLALTILEQLRSGAIMTETKTISTVMENVETKLAGLREQNPILAEIEEAFEIAKEIVAGAIKMVTPAVIIAGPPGVGKTFSILRQIIESGVKHEIISGACTGPGLYNSLWACRNGGLVLVDDCDDLFGDETTLNLLKVALNSDNRNLGWRKSAPWVFNGTETDYEMELADLRAQIEAIENGANETDEEDEDEETPASKLRGLRLRLESLSAKLPKQFEFRGSVVFITNKDFYGEIERGTSNAVHLEALLDRAVYLDLDMNSPEKLVTRMVQGIEQFDILGKLGVPEAGKAEIKDFIVQNYTKLTRLSFRSVEKIGGFFVSGPLWKRTTARTLFKRGMKLED